MRAAKALAPVGPTNQQQIPGTQKGSDLLRATHEKYTTAKYEAKRQQEIAESIKAELMEAMQAEGIEDLSAEIDVGDQVRRVVTVIETKTKLRSKLDPVDDGADD